MDTNLYVKPFDTSRAFIRTGAQRIDSFIRAELRKLQPPKDIRARNLAQLVLADRLRATYELDLVSAVEAIAPMYAAKFPH